MEMRAVKANVLLLTSAGKSCELSPVLLSFEMKFNFYFLRCIGTEILAMEITSALTNAMYRDRTAAVAAVCITMISLSHIVIPENGFTTFKCPEISV